MGCMWPDSIKGSYHLHSGASLQHCAPRSYADPQPALLLCPLPEQPCAALLLQCGACWAFAAVAALESKYLITRSQQLDLSEQHMIDCVTAAAGFSSNGCEGGWPTDALQYAVRYNTSFEESYPYM